MTLTTLYKAFMVQRADLWTAVLAVALASLCYLLASRFRLVLNMRVKGVDLQEDQSLARSSGSQDSEEKIGLRNLVESRQIYDVFLVLDVEGTCELGSGFDYPNEIIEFPVCLMKWKNDKERRELEVVDEFHSFVKPSWRPTLTNFCMGLTGINQAQVDNSPSFPQVLESVSQFLVKHGVLDANYHEPLLRFCWCSDGPYDVRDFVVKQCFISKIAIPAWLRGDVLDVKKMVISWFIRQNYRGRKMKTMLGRTPLRPSLNIDSQLRVLGLPAFQGRKHSGIDDARNIARIVSECAHRNICLQPNTHIDPNRRWSWMGKSGQILLQR
ncbi:ribonuclease H-like domain-containing protein [Lentinula guzmanii]|uniref:Ribonuclease H-like domain-containing protein n=1 Tax=Lentinula guzmanii TaxID=2804957 RepID=A0AA38MVR5_9AGAR|nr:ribonuclease H-like domain-containing protein [Lentinula guzmanii]